MKIGLIIKYTDVMSTHIARIYENGIKISKDFISVQDIQSITFTNNHPQINGVYTAYRNQVYCVIQYFSNGKLYTIIFQPISHIWEALKSLCSDKFFDETNGLSTSLLCTTVYGVGYERPSKKLRLLMVILNIFFSVLFVVSLIYYENFIERELPIIPFVVLSFLLIVDTLVIVLRRLPK